ncbi:MAG: hypothetical protein MJ174_11500 [Treponema sp.]|nr:hypothetical protein [Treponema sp.]
MNTEHRYTKQQVIDLLEACLEKTLGEIDKNKVFDRTKTNPKITGIAGDVIEQSVFGYPANNDSNPDLIIDEIPTELKTTGIKLSAKKKGFYEAKEPMSITGVSPDNIINEEFNNSRFWHKLEHLLFVYYLYSSNKPVLAAEYANFLFKGYQFVEFDEADVKVLEKDWLTVRDFIISLNKNEKLYPEISHLRDKLLYIDTSPKWPNKPRFRLKRSVVTNIVQQHFNGKLEQLPKNYSSYSEIDKKCHDLTVQYKGKTVLELMATFGIDSKINKGISEQIIVKMFGGLSKKMNQIELFNKIGLYGKSIVLTPKGKRTEDMKLFRIDFDEISYNISHFEDSSFHDYFSGMQILCIVFEEKNKADFGSNVFMGFKRIAFSDEFIELNVQSVWERINKLVIYNELKDIPVINKKTGKPKVNKTGTIQSAPNFPKSSEGVIFVRGDSSDSTKKPECVNGIKMYRQYIWIKGSYLSELLARVDYL